MATPHDDELARKYGGYISFRTETEPYKYELYGDTHDDDFDRLIRTHVQPTSRVVDIGCGAGQYTCDTAARAGELWGIEPVAEVVAAARERAMASGLTNVHFVQGNHSDPGVLEVIPSDLDVIYSRRGPNLSAPLADKLKVGGIFLQLLVSEFDGYPLREIMGRRYYSPHHFSSEHDVMVHYAQMAMQPISIKSHFFDAFFRDIAHLEAFLITIPATLADWRLGMLPYDRERDRAALELYARYNTTPDGICLLRHRRVMSFRKIELRYPLTE